MYSYCAFMLTLAKSLSYFPMVAEKSMVCTPLGRFFMICSMVSLKPMSRILSTSSKTKTFKLEGSKPSL
jgi:hypothetical protein